MELRLDKCEKTIKMKRGKLVEMERVPLAEGNEISSLEEDGEYKYLFLLYGLPDTKLGRLRRIQNIAARIVTRSPKSYHITPVLEQLHWLPVRMRILYTLMVLIYRAVEGTGPSYLRDIITLYRPNTSTILRSEGRLDLPQGNLLSHGDRAFSVAAPFQWNKLPSDLTNCSSHNAFKFELKT